MGLQWNGIMSTRLHYRRMFVLTRGAIESPSGWNCLRIGQYFVYAHPDLDMNLFVCGKKEGVLIGDIYDSLDPQKSNRDILHDIVACADNAEECIERVKQYAGCFAMVFKSDRDFIIFHDARGLREIYYCTGVNRVVCGSQPNLIAQFADPKVGLTSEDELARFYHDALWDSRWVGDETMFAGVKHLLPNHLLDIDIRKSRRYWPNRILETITLEEGIGRTSLFLRGVLKAIVARHPSMMAVTAGEDSRILLAASKGLQDKIYYFVNDHELGCKHPDIAVPKQIFEAIGVPFHVHDVFDNGVDADFRKMFYHNTFLAADRLLPSIYNLYVKDLREKVLILGVSEIGRTFYGKAPTPLTGNVLASKIGYQCHPYVIRQCALLVDELLTVSAKYGVNPMALFYWEQRLGNWGAVRNSESLIAIDKVDPFNCRFVYETYLQVDERYRNYQDTPCVFTQELIRVMWPELLEWPVNPLYGFRDRAKVLLSYVHLLGMFRVLKFWAVQIKYTISKAVHLCVAAPRNLIDRRKS